MLQANCGLQAIVKARRQNDDEQVVIQHSTIRINKNHQEYNNTQKKERKKE